MDASNECPVNGYWKKKHCGGGYAILKGVKTKLTTTDTKDNKREQSLAAKGLPEILWNCLLSRLDFLSITQLQQWSR